MHHLNIKVESIHIIDETFHCPDVSAWIEFIVPFITTGEGDNSLLAIIFLLIGCIENLVDGWLSLLKIQQNLAFTSTTVIWNLEQDACVDRVIRYFLMILMLLLAEVVIFNVCSRCVIFSVLKAFSMMLMLMGSSCDFSFISMPPFIFAQSVFKHLSDVLRYRDLPFICDL